MNSDEATNQLPEGVRKKLGSGAENFAEMRDLSQRQGVPFCVVFVPNPVLVYFDPADGAACKFATFWKMGDLRAAFGLNKPNAVFGGYFE